MKKLPKTVKFIKYHWRHCKVFDPALVGESNDTLFEHSVSMGWHHAPTGPSPEEACKTWLKEHGYTFQSNEDSLVEVWAKSDPTHCDTCGAKLAPGQVDGNHVRGDKDQFCDKCIGGKSI